LSCTQDSACRAAEALPRWDLVAFEVEGTWSNTDQGEPQLPPENRALGFAVSSLSFVQA
jgi:hypothetical protein